MTEAQKTNDDNLFPIHHRQHHTEFTQKEIEDIVRFADVHDLNAVDKAKLIQFVRDVRAAHRSRAIGKKDSAVWPSLKQSDSTLESEDVVGDNSF
ncbi:MAG TPA: hypothetical protein V6C85_34975 [Allocoleopsis sp.]